MGKKGGGKKGGKGGKGSAKGGWQPAEVPDIPLGVRKTVSDFFTVQVRGVVWRVMDFTARVPSSMTVYQLRSMIEDRHGGGVTDFALYKEEVHRRNLLSEPAQKLSDLDFSTVGEDPRVIFYDFEPRADDCPLLLRPPSDLRIEALAKAEEDARREREARHAALKGGGQSKADARPSEGQGA